jgi:hypothetical protein
METTERFAYPAKTKWSFTCGSSLTCKTLFTIATSQLLHVKRNELLLFIHGCSGLLEQPHLLDVIGRFSVGEYVACFALDY